MDPAAVFCDSQVNTERSFIFSWTIPNFEAICDSVSPNQFLRSPVFTSSGSKSNLYIKLCPNSTHPSGNTTPRNNSMFAQNIVNGNCIILTVEKLSDYFDYCIKTGVTVAVLITVLSEGKVIKTYDMHKGAQYLYHNEIPRESQHNRIFGREYSVRSVTFSCEITENIEEDTMTGRRLKEFDDLELLLQDKEHSDVTLEVGGEQLLAHKCILSKKSPVFAAMFKHDMLENNKNLVKIDDFSVNVMKELLLFVYAGKVGDVKSFAHELYEAADKYSVEGLKVICEDVMCQNINKTIVYDYLNFARHIEINKLRNACIDFISRHSSDLKSST